MKIFEIQLETPDSDVVYRTLVPEVHILEKIITIVKMNEISAIGAIKIAEKGDISDRYIHTYLRGQDPDSDLEVKIEA